MRIENIKNIQNFEGKLVKKNKLSQKPERCLKRVCNDVQGLIKNKDYHLYITQDYTNNLISISAEYPFPIKPEQRSSYTRIQKFIPITSNAAKYKETAESVINAFEENKFKCNSL